MYLSTIKKLTAKKYLSIIVFQKRSIAHELLKSVSANISHTATGQSVALKHLLAVAAHPVDVPLVDAHLVLAQLLPEMCSTMSHRVSILMVQCKIATT